MSQKCSCPGAPCQVHVGHPHMARIVLSEWDIRAILDGRKTTIRFPVVGDQVPKYKRDDEFPGMSWTAIGQHGPRYGFIVSGETEEECAKSLGENGACPNTRGMGPGCLLWVQEAHCINDYREAGVPADERINCEVFYRAEPLPDMEGEESLVRWRASTQMPKWACRLVLQITAKRVERLKAITIGGILREGLARSMYEFVPVTSAFDGYAEYWNDCHPAAPWDSNPWAWVFEFKVVKSEREYERL